MKRLNVLLLTFVTFWVSACHLEKVDRIAFVSDRDGNWEIYMLSLDGNQMSRLTDDSSSDMQPAWSPDGQRLAFSSDRENGGIYLMNNDGSDVVQVVNDRRAVTPAWSPDGKHIAFSTNRNLHGLGEIYLINIETGEENQLTNASHGGMEPSWSPDGDKIVYWSLRDGICVITIDNKSEMCLRDSSLGGWSPVWSPDGNWIAFASEENGNIDIYMMKPDGKEITRLTSDPARDEDPSWLPDSSSIIFSSDRTDKLWRLYIVDVKDKSVTSVSENSESHQIQPVWTP